MRKTKNNLYGIIKRMMGIIKMWMTANQLKKYGLDWNFQKIKKEVTQEWEKSGFEKTLKNSLIAQGQNVNRYDDIVSGEVADRRRFTSGRRCGKRDAIIATYMRKYHKKLSKSDTYGIEKRTKQEDKVNNFITLCIDKKFMIPDDSDNKRVCLTANGDSFTGFAWLGLFRELISELGVIWGFISAIILAVVVRYFEVIINWIRNMIL